MKPVLVLAGLLTLGCATTDPESPPQLRSCDASRLGDLTGRPASQQLGAEAVRRSGARALRWIRPGDAVTMDYRPDRLNIEIGSDGRIKQIRCG